MTPPLLSLVMMVKNEAKSLRGVLEAARPFIDCWTILDTGSSDETLDIVREVLADKPGRLIEGEFTGYASTRNRVMELDRALPAPGLAACAEFQLMLSGDEFLRHGEDLRGHLEQHSLHDYLGVARTSEPADGHMMRLVLDGKRQYQLRVFRTGSAWKFESALPLGLHEYAANPGAAFATVPGATIEHIPSDEEDRLNTIWTVHIPALEEHVHDHPEDETALFYLAQSYVAMLGTTGFSPGERITYAMRAMSFYKRRLAIDTGNPVQRNFCEMQYLDCARVAEVYTEQELAMRLRLLAEKDPHRPEVANMLALASMNVLPLKDVYQLFAHAAKVAELVEQIDNASPVSTVCGVEAHYFAALCAKQLATVWPDEYRPRVEEHMGGGLAAAGQCGIKDAWSMFRKITAEPEAEKQILSEPTEH